MRLIALLLIVLAGLALRMDHAWQGPDENLPDSAAYERIARGLHEDGAFEQVGPGTPAHPQPASNYSPGLPFFAGGVFELTGSDDVRLVRILLALISTLAIPLCFLIGRRLGGDAAGLIAAAAVAFYPTLITYSGMLLTEPLAGTLIAGAVLAILKARDQRRLLPWAGAGLLLGLTTMVRPEYLWVSFLLALALVAIEIRGGFGHAIRPVAVMLLALGVVIAPWTIRNAIEYERLVPLSTGGGQTLYSGSYLPSGGNPTKVMPDLLRDNPVLLAEIERQNVRSGEGPESITPERVFGLLAAQQLPHMDTDAALARLGRERYMAALRNDPAGLASYFWRKALRIWWRGRAGFMQSDTGRMIHWLIIVSAITGLALLAVRRRPEFWIFGSIVLAATMIGVVLVASPRRALALWPLVAVLAGFGIRTAAELVRLELQRRKRPVAIA
ncbi:MAG TPA: glycosyltransferase family 39 protein [Solirubrobacterales bacterium]|nr:glycosyltransferase family 39 protein [Solirubrobacterales bacterium]